MADLAVHGHPDRGAVSDPAALGELRLQRTITLLAALSWLARLIHVSVIPEHWSEYRPYAVCFGVLASLQAAGAVAFFRTPTRTLLRGAALLSFPVIAVWALSRTSGLPFGPDAGQPEAVGLADLAASALELFLGLNALVLARTWPSPTIPAWLTRLDTTVLVAGGIALVLRGHGQ